MEISPDQKSFDFEAQKPEIVEVPVEADEDKECGMCGNLLASRISKSCTACADNPIKTNWLKNHPEETSH